MVRNILNEFTYILAFPFLSQFFLKSHDKKQSPFTSSEMMRLRSVSSEGEIMWGTMCHPINLVYLHLRSFVLRNVLILKVIHHRKSWRMKRFGLLRLLYFLIKLIWFMAQIRTLIPFARHPSSLLTAVHRVALLSPTIKVLNVYFHLWLL